MSDVKVRVMLAVTADGYIAREDGSFDFLDPFGEAHDDWDEFIAGIDSIVMGRSTYEQAAAMDRWLWDDKRVWVLTRRPIENARPNVRAFDDPAALVAQLKDEGRGDVWHMGGGLSIQPFEQAGLIDRWELVIIPIRLGAGIPLFVDGPETRLKLTKVKQRPLDVVELWYEPALGGAA